MVILYGHPESGHNHKVALNLVLMGEAFDYRWVEVFAAHAASISIRLHLARKYGRLGGESPARLARWPAIQARVARIRALPLWQGPAIPLRKPV